MPRARGGGGGAIPLSSLAIDRRCVSSRNARNDSRYPRIHVIVAREVLMRTADGT